MTRITIITLLAITACADDDRNPPAPPGGTDSDPTEDSLTEDDPDSTAGEQCEDWGMSWWKWVHRGDGTTEPGLRTTNADGETVIGWQTYTLPDLGKDAYRWKMRPGTEVAT